jgi:hypothetical protein
MTKLFNKAAFESSFSQALEKIATSENVTKRELRDLSRSILTAWHETGNVIYINRLLKVLTPVNKKVMVKFAIHFGGFSYDETMGEFTHKSKKRYDAAHKLAIEFLENPNNNLWSWAERHIEIEHKPFAVENVEKFIKGALTKGAGVGLSQVDILKAVFKAGIDPACVVQVMDEMGFEFSETTEPVQGYEQAPM